MARKGITPIIAIIILLLITIALAASAWTFLSGFLGTQIEKSFFVPIGGAYCVGGTIKVTVVNTGTTTIKASDFIVHSIDDANVVINSTLEIPVRSGILVIDDDNNGNNWSSSTYTVYIGTTASVQQIPVTCA